MTEQPQRAALPPSVLEANLVEVTEAADRENEWGTAAFDDLSVCSALCRALALPYCSCCFVLTAALVQLTSPCVCAQEYRAQKKSGLLSMVRGAFGAAQAAAASGEFAGCIGSGRFAGSAGVGELSSLADILESLQFAGALSKNKGSRFQHQTDFAQEQPVMAVAVNLASDEADTDSVDPAVVVDPEEEARKVRGALVMPGLRVARLARCAACCDFLVLTPRRLERARCTSLRNERESWKACSSSWPIFWRRSKTVGRSRARKPPAFAR